MADPAKDNPVMGLKAWYIIMIVLAAIGTVGSALLLGTLAGLMLRKINNPEAKKYLNYRTS